ncbi:hypothetical protein [Bacillus sp. FJAT-45350]|uniref:hypothetical protein n=1 Tax=Bacillus sp. FJAT-45350 TaxID=2011014 RepID=UPI000BB7209F|nr:hypothetical protein [Bacillus sp. FJAT-45350]
MPRKTADSEKENPAKENIEEQIEMLNGFLASVLNYLSDDEVDEIDIEYLLDHTEGLREWWDKYRERNKKQLEDEIKKSLGVLSLKELEGIREMIKEKEA